VDQLPSGGRQEGEHLQGGRGHHHQAPCHHWKQVTRALISKATSLEPNSLTWALRTRLLYRGHWALSVRSFILVTASQITACVAEVAVRPYVWKKPKGRAACVKFAVQSDACDFRGHAYVHAWQYGMMPASAYGFEIRITWY
jgi:hypothetical protein